MYLAQKPGAVHLIVLRGELLHGDVVREVVPQATLLLALFPFAGPAAFRATAVS